MVGRVGRVRPISFSAESCGSERLLKRADNCIAGPRGPPTIGGLLVFQAIFMGAEKEEEL
jgi:hypothetical protein